MRRSAVRFATLKRRFRFNAYFSFCSFCLLWDIFVYLHKQTNNNNNTHACEPKVSSKFFFCQQLSSFCFRLSVFCLFSPTCFFRLIFLRFLSVVALEVRRKSNVTLSFIHARTRAFIWTRSRTDRALESNELNGRNISSWIKAKYDRERASREITRLDVVTRREREENNCVSSPPRNWEKKPGHINLL